MKRVVGSLLLAASLGLAGVAFAKEPDDGGVIVGRGSIVRYLYPASFMESTAAQQYTALKQEATSKRALLPPNHQTSERLRRIAKNLLPHADKWNPRSKAWVWEVVAIQSNNVNAFCMPGG